MYSKMTTKKIRSVHNEKRREANKTKSRWMENFFKIVRTVLDAIVQFIKPTLHTYKFGLILLLLLLLLLLLFRP